MNNIENEYAASLFSLAEEKGEEKATLEGLHFLISQMKEEPSLSGFLASPAVPKAVRLTTLREAYEGKVAEYVLSYLCVLCENRRIGIFADSIKEYEKLYESKFGRVRAVVTSAVLLSDEEKARLIAGLEKKLRAHVEAEYRIDPAMLGGITVKTEGLTLDGSLASRLQAMKERVIASDQ